MDAIEIFFAMGGSSVIFIIACLIGLYVDEKRKERE